MGKWNFKIGAGDCRGKGRGESEGGMKRFKKIEKKEV